MEEAVQGMSEREPVRVPEEVLEGLEAVQRYAGTDVLDIATIRYLAQERGRGALAVGVDKHPHVYARGVLDGFRAEEQEKAEVPTLGPRPVREVYPAPG